MSAARIATLLLGLALPAALPATAASVAPAAATADPAAVRRALGGLAQELARAQSIEGRYTQRKFLRELPQPLRADGEFVFARGLGIAWRTITPFASELIITPDALIQRDNGNSQRIDADRQPAVRLVARIFFAVFSLDFDELAQLFTLSVDSAADGRWQLGLKPRQDAGAITAIVVSGAREVERVRLLEAGGDRTEIDFHDTRTSAAPIAAALRQRFE